MKILNNKKEVIPALCFISALTVFICIFTVAVTPKRVDYGATWGSFTLEEKNTVDIMFFGSSLVYCNIVPAVIYEETGITSYVMAGPEQTLPITYYYIKEMYKNQSPKLVFVEITGAFFERGSKFEKINVGYMPWSLNRLEAVFNCLTKEEWLGALFPLYDYHDLWPEIRPSSFSGYSLDMMAGYTFLDSAIDASPEFRLVDMDKVDFDKNIEYLEKIVELCEAQGSRLIFFIAPSYYRLGQEYLDMLSKEVKTMEREGIVEFINFNDDYASIGINDLEDYYDLLHFNYRGAEKFSVSLSRYIEGFGIEPRYAGDIWKERAEYFKLH